MIDYRSRTQEVNDLTYASWNAHDADAVAAGRVEGATFTRLGADGLVIEDVHTSDLAGLLAQLS